MDCLCQIRNETDVLAKGAANAVFDLYEVVTHDLLSSDLRYDIYYALSFMSYFMLCCVFFKYFCFCPLPSKCFREQLDTWSLLAKARNEGRLFSRIKWTNDPETVSIFESKQKRKRIRSCCMMFEIFRAGFFNIIYFLIVATERAGEAVTPSSYCKGFCSKYSKES